MSHTAGHLNMSDKVEVPVLALAQVIERLTERRIAVEKAVTTLGEAPSGLRDVFELCRGFERAFTNLVNESPVASKIREAFFSDKGLQGQIHKLVNPRDKLFEIESVKKITKTADGYQPHLVSPERGLQLMASKALDLVVHPVEDCVHAVYNLLVTAAREAADMAGEHTEAAMSGKVPLKVPEFKNFIMPSVVRALDEWRREALQMANMMVDMERSYITAGFFRYTMHRRFEQFQQNALLHQALNKQPAKRGFFGLGKGEDNNAAAGGPPDPSGRSGSSAAGPTGAGQVGGLSDGDAFLAGYLDKKVNEESARQSMPVNAWRYQKRFFVYNDGNKMLYYFKSPDDVQKPNGLRGTINMADCVVEDLDERGAVRAQISSPAIEMQRGERASLLLRIRSIDPRRPCVKDHATLTLKADGVGQKYEWIARMNRAHGGAAAAAPAPPPAAAAVPPQPQAPGQPPAGSAATSAAPTPRTSQGGGPPLGPGAPGVTISTDEDPTAASSVPTVGVVPQPGVEGLAEAGRRNSFEVMADAKLGQGAKFFRAEHLRDDHGHLLPAPGIVLAPATQQQASKLQQLLSSKGGATVTETWETRYEQLMQQFASDMNLYINMVCDTIVMTVPKSVVHCMVRKAEKGLLNHMFGHVHAMSEVEIKRMLQEDQDVVERRKVVRELFEKVKMAIDDVQYMQEKIKRKDEDGETVNLKAEVLALAAMVELMPGELIKKYSELIKNPHLPEMRAPVPLSHMSRPKKLPTAPAGLLEDGSGSTSGGGAASANGSLGRPSVGGPKRAPPPGPPGASANGIPSTPMGGVRRAPPPPPPAGRK